MAPKRGNKRAASAQAENPADKQLFELLKTQGIPRTTYKAVTDSLEHPLLVLSDGCRKMLLTMVPKSLCVPSDERHALQVQGVDMIGKAMQEVQTKMQEAIEAEQATVTKTEGKKSELESDLQKAMETLTKEQEKLGASKKVLQEATESLSSAKTDLASKLLEQANFDDRCTAIKADKEMFERVSANDLKVLLEGVWEDGKAQAHFDVLAGLFGKFELEESLRSVLPGSLLKKPEERGTFELMAVKQLEESIKGKLGELTIAVDQQVPQAQELEVAAASAQKICDQASEAEKVAVSTVSACQEQEKIAMAAVTSAEQALGAGEAEFKSAGEVRDLKKAELEAFQHNLECYGQLKEKATAAAGA